MANILAERDLLSNLIQLAYKLHRRDRPSISSTATDVPSVEISNQRRRVS